MSTPPSDAQLDQWIRQFSPSLNSLIRSCVRDADDAADLLQEVWIRAALHAHRRQAAMPLGPWLHGVALNLIRSTLRRERRRAKLRTLFSADIEWLHGRAAVPDAPLEASPLWAVVADLPRLQREVLLLRVLEDRSVADAAAILGKAEGTIKASLHRALAALRRRLPAKPPSPLAPSTTLCLENESNA